MTTTITIPGGTAELYGPRELTPRRRKPSELLATMLGRTLTQIGTAQRLLCDGLVVEDRTRILEKDGEIVPVGEDEDIDQVIAESGATRKYLGPDLDLTRSQLALINELNDVGAWALLKSWTLPDPLPATPDAFLDIPGPVYDAVRAEAAKIIAESKDIATVFSPDALGDDPDQADTSLPTSASAD